MKCATLKWRMSLVVAKWGNTLPVALYTRSDRRPSVRIRYRTSSR